jgi:hypothetical protein
LKNDLLLVFENVVLFWIRKASANMTAGFSVKNSHIEDDLVLVLKKQTPTVKVITVRLKLWLFVIWPWQCIPQLRTAR